MLLPCFEEIRDERRAQGRMYDLPHVLLFTVLGISSGADSYRKVHTYMKENLKKLKTVFNIEWKKAPGYTTIRSIIIGVDAKELEKAFREYTKQIANLDQESHKFVAIDGKVLRGSLDKFNDKKALQILSAFLVEEELILAHEEIEEKTNEIPMAQKMIKSLGLENCIYTMDALHTQKKR